MTRLLLDENIPATATARRAAAGHDVVHMSRVSPGAGDRAVMTTARLAGRCLVTLDADFGDLAFRQGEPPPPAVIYLRLHPISLDEVVACTLRALDESPVIGFIIGTSEGMRRRTFVQA